MSADDDIAQTLARAGTRPPLSARMSREVRERTEKAWREALASRVASRRRRRLLLAAASVLVATGLGLAIGWHVEQRAVTPVGIFLASRGSVDIRAPDDARLAVGGMTVAAGTRVHTGAAGQALLTIGEISVRIGPLSAVTLLRADRIQIDAGKTHTDAGTALCHQRAVQFGVERTHEMVGRKF